MAQKTIYFCSVCNRVFGSNPRDKIRAEVCQRLGTPEFKWKVGDVVRYQKWDYEVLKCLYLRVKSGIRRRPKHIRRYLLRHTGAIRETHERYVKEEDIVQWQEENLIIKS